jgi:putative two-component system response regulator
VDSFYNSELNQIDILVVDDTLANIQILSAILKEKGYKVRPVLDGKTALQAIQMKIPDLICLDINMPGMNGYEVCDVLKKDSTLKDIPVIFISALSEPLDKVKAFNMGGVDYITKPFEHEEVLARIKTHLNLRSLQNELVNINLHLQEKVAEQINEILDSQMATILALAKLAEYRDDDTGYHLERIQYFCKLLTDKLIDKGVYQSLLTPNFVQNIFHASPLHDIGKVGIPDDILLKPGKHTPDEFNKMKDHTTIGSNLLKEVLNRYPKNSFINTGIDIARSHHEKWDGSGYPDGLKGSDIPVSARILALADVYDAMRSKRPYKKPFSHMDTFHRIVQDSGTHFDPEIVKIFREIHLDFEKKYDTLTFIPSRVTL